MYQKEVFEDMQSNTQFENILYFPGSSGLGKSRFAKDFGRITSLTARVSIQFILLQRQIKIVYDFIDSEYKAQDDTF